MSRSQGVHHFHADKIYKHSFVFDSNCVDVISCIELELVYIFESNKLSTLQYFVLKVLNFVLTFFNAIFMLGVQMQDTICLRSLHHKV